MKCAACQAGILDGAKFCSACGAPVATRCAVCGTPNPPGANFCSECGASLGTGRPSPAPAPQPAVPIVVSAERRQLSVLFCDLEGSTELSSRLDPEDLGILTRDYQRLVATAMTRFGGFVARYLGDGVLVYFGWPRATEADPEQALRAALSAAQAVSAAPIRGETLRVRIGVATGLVVVGDTVEGGEAQEQTAIGETPNRAARLQTLATPGGIVIDAATRRQVAGLFDLHALGSVTLKGLPEPIEVFEVLGEHPEESRFEALHATELAPLIGRQEELDLLLRRWHQAREGQGRVVLIAGEPGIGKSRLLAELNARLSSESFRRIRLICSPHATHTPLHPVMRQIEFDARFTRDSPPTERAQKLRARLEAVDTSAEDIALFTSLLRLPNENLPPLNLSPQRRKERTFVALLRRVESMSAARPLLIVVEDMHWADPSTRELIDHLIRRLTGLRVLLIITYRPEYSAPWAGHAGVTSLMLSRLEHKEAAMLAEQFATHLVLPQAVIDQIIVQSDGVPLFIEELTQAIVEAEPHATSPLSQVSVPATLQASLLARLDRMPTARHVAQIGSVFGREFPRALFGAVADMPAETIDEGLDRLVAAGLLFRRGEGAEADYVFKHALVQDAAYDSLLRTRRAALHAAIGAVMESDPETQAMRPALLGHHFAQAGNANQASRYFLRAGEQSVAASAMTEAEAHLTRGLTLAADIASPTERNLRKAELTLTLGNVRMAVQGVGSPGHRATFAEAAELCRALSSQDAISERLLARTLFGQWTYELQVGNLAKALETGRHLYAAARNSLDPGLRAAAAGHAIGYTFMGRLEEAIAAFAPAIADTGIRANRVPAREFGFDPTCHLYAQYARSLVLRGYAEQAQARLQFALDRAAALQHLPTVSVTLMIACTTAWSMRDRAALNRHSQTLVRIASEQGYGFWHARGLSYAGWVKAAEGAHDDGLAMIDEAIRRFDAMQIELSGPHTRAMRADVHAWMERADLAEADIDEALAICTHTGEIWPVAELHRRKGELRRADPANAEACFRQAVTVAKEQGAKLFELRASVSLAHLWHEQGRHPEAHGLLAPIYGWFSEGFNTPDLLDAQALLAEAETG